MVQTSISRVLSYMIYFDLEYPVQRDALEYCDFHAELAYFRSISGSYILADSAYCGALFLGVF